MEVERMNLSLLKQLYSSDPEKQTDVAQGIVEKLISQRKSNPNVIEPSQGKISPFMQCLIRGLSSEDLNMSKVNYLIITAIFSRVKYTFEDVLNLIDSTCQPEKTNDRAVLLSRLFSYNSILDSGAFLREKDHLKALFEICDRLVKIGQSNNNYMEAACAVMIKYLLSESISNLPKNSKNAIVEKLFKEPISDLNMLWVLDVLQDKYKDLEWNTLISEPWKSGVLSENGGLSKTIELFKTHNISGPNYHSIWDSIISTVLKNNSYSTLEKLWVSFNDAIAAKGFNGKVTILKLFSMILKSKSHHAVFSIYTKFFHNLLITAIRNDGISLHSHACSVLSEIVKIADKAPEVVSVLIPLISDGIHINKINLEPQRKACRFLLSKLSLEKIKNYLLLLQESFLKNENPDTRIFYLDCMYQIFNARFDGIDDEIAIDCLSFIALTIIFDSTNVSTWKNMVLPSNLEAHVRENALSVFKRIIKTASNKKHGQNNTSKRLNYYLFEVLKIINNFYNNGKTHLYNHEEPPEIVEIRNNFYRLVEKLNNIVTNVDPSPENKNISMENNALFDLCSYTLFLSYYKHSETIEYLEDLYKSCCLLLRGEDIATLRNDFIVVDDVDPNAVLVDILLSCASKPCSLMRSIVNAVVSSRAPHMSVECVKLILSAIEGDDTNDDNENCDVDSNASDNYDGDNDDDKSEEDSDYDNQEGDADYENDGNNRCKKLKLSDNHESLPAFDVLLSDNDEVNLENVDEELEQLSMKLLPKKKTADFETIKIKERFSICCIDMIDFIIKRTNTNTLKFNIIAHLISTLENLSSNTKKKTIQSHLIKVVARNYNQIKHVPRIPAEEGIELLKIVNEKAAAINDKNLTYVLGILSNYVTKVLKVSCNETNINKQSQKEDHSTSCTEVYSKISEIYGKTLYDFLHNEKTKIRFHFFESFIKKCPDISHVLLPQVFEYTSSDREMSHHMVNIYRLLEMILRATTSNKGSETSSILNVYGPKSLLATQKRIDNTRNATSGLKNSRNAIVRRKLMIRCNNILRHKHKISDLKDEVQNLTGS